MVELKTLQEYFEDSEEANRDSRIRSERSRDYYDNNQLTDEEKNTLAKRKQPIIVQNLIQPKVDFMLGAEQEARTDPRAFPRTPQHDEGSNAVTDSIRFVLDNNNFNNSASEVFENILIEGTGGVAVEAELKRNEIWIIITRFRWDRFFYDMHSMARDFSDANYMGIVVWMDLEDAKLRWPKAAKELTANMAAFPFETFDDKPILWWDRKRNRVMLIDMAFIHEGKWHQSIFGKGVWLEQPKASVYLDDDGLPANKFIAQSAKVKRDGERYGFVEGLMDRQDIVNKTHSKAMHILNSKLTFSKQGMLNDRIDSFKAEIHKPDGHLEFPVTGEFGKDFGVIPTEHLVAPQFNMYLDAKNGFDVAGVNAALSGTAEKGLSGRAVRSLQKGGMLELGPWFDAHSQFKLRVFRAVWDRIRQFWREEKWLRVTDDEDNLRFVGLNIPFSLAEQRIMQGTGLKLSEVRQQFSEEINQIHQMQPELAQIVQVENEVVEMDVDIILEEVPDVVNVQAEEFEILSNMYIAAPDEDKARLWKEVISMSTLRHKDRVLGKDPTPEERQEQEQQLQQQLEALDLQKRHAEAGIKATLAKAFKDKADAQKVMIENEASGSDINKLLNLDEKIVDLDKKDADLSLTKQKALQTMVETNISIRNPDPNPQVIT